MIGRQAASQGVFLAFVAQGIGVWLGVQAFINMGVNMGCSPKRAHSAIDEFWWQQYSCKLPFAGRAVARGLGKPAVG